VKDTVAGRVIKPFADGLGVTTAEMVGFVLSIFKVTLAGAVWPAASVAVALITWPAPSVVTGGGVGQLTGGTPPLQVYETVTFVLFQLFVLAAGKAEAVIASDADSTFNVTVAGSEEFPATSVAVPLNVWLAPRVVTLMGRGHVATPDVASEQMNVMVAGATTTPFEFGAGTTAELIVGMVLSIFSGTGNDAEWPTASVAVTVITWLLPSVLTVCGPGQTTGATPPVHVEVIVTLLLFQPAALGGGEAT